MKEQRDALCSADCTLLFFARATKTSFHRKARAKHKKHDTRELELFKGELRCAELLCLCSETYCCYDVASNKFKVSIICLNKRKLEQNGEGLLEVYNRFLWEKSILPQQIEVSKH